MSESGVSSKVGCMMRTLPAADMGKARFMESVQSEDDPCR